MYILQYYITKSPTYLGASAPSSEIFDVSFAKVIRYY